MPARAISAGTLCFGLVSIPIKVYTATSSKDVHFSMLHERDKARVRQQLVCSTCGEVVERGATVKGYEYARGQYVVMTDDEIGSLSTKSDQTLEIEEFVPIESVDPLFFEKSNLLGPDKGGQKAYRLLHRAMLEAGRVAVGRFSTRGRQQLVLVRPMGPGLVLHGLYYADEVRSFADIEIDEGIVLKDTELGLARQLIEQLSRQTFDARKYEDHYRSTLLEAVDRKVAGEEIVVARPAETQERIIDLVAALKQSLAAKREAEPASESKQTRKAAKAKGKRAASS